MIIPPIKIQGKKTKLIPKIMEVADGILKNHPEIDTWVEPFLGSGVVAFNCPNKIKNVVVSDINPHIINLYSKISQGEITGEIINERFTEYGNELLKGGYDYYNEIKDRFNSDFNSLDFLFLTRTGFNGVLRFNSKGLWNVPFCKLNNRLNSNVVDDLSKSVDMLYNLFKSKSFTFYNKSFESVIETAPENSIFYCDPPYYGLQTQYYKGWCEDQEIQLNKMLYDKTFIYSTWLNDGHKDNPMIDKLWKNFVVTGEEHKYNVASKASERMKMTEGIIYSEIIDKQETSLF